MDEQFLSPVEVAEILQVKKNTVYEMIKRGDLKATKMGKQFRIARNDLYEYIIRKCKEEVRDVERGEFGAMMHVELLNEGPFTIILDSAEMGWA